MKYYSITVQNSSGTLNAGERFYNSCAPLSIGQQPTADIQLPCSEDLLPQTFCVIVKNQNGEGWLVVRKSEFYAVRVGDTDLAVVAHLVDGDAITVDGHTFVFNTHDDEGYVEGQGLVRVSAKHNPRQWMIWGLSLVLILVASIGFQMCGKRMNSFSPSDNEKVHTSVYKIIVSEYLFQQHTPGDAEGVYRTVASYEPDSISVGTCFFTRDSLCVTARHCVEPWVDFMAWEDNVTFTSLPQEVRWAVQAEQTQLAGADTLYRLVTRCQVFDGDSCIHEFSSEKCSFNRSRDIIAHMGDARFPWRIIYPLYKRQDVELGDFAFVKTPFAGELELASDDYLIGFNPEDDGEIRIYGYPQTNHGNLWEYQRVTHLAMPEYDEDGFSCCLQLTVSGTSGYSGAPVIAKRRGQMTVIGIFSKIDDLVDNKETFYAVPANEVSHYNPTKVHETKQYRR